MGTWKCLHHRRGYAGSSPVDAPRTIPDDAIDCAALLDALDIGRAHVVRVSFSEAVGLQLAADFSERVHTITVLEPPPVLGLSPPEFRAANDRLRTARRERGVGLALDEFLTMLVGPDWRHITEQQLPGTVPQMQRLLRSARSFSTGPTRCGRHDRRSRSFPHITHPGQIAGALVAFLERHRM